MRFGFYQTVKINREYFVDRRYEPDRWYQIDVLLDWEHSNSALFIDGKYVLLADFYSKARDEALTCNHNSVNMLSLYTLSPGVVSSFRDLRVCSDLCPSNEAVYLPLQEKDKEDSPPLEDPFTVFTTQGADYLNGSVLALLAFSLFFYI